MRDVARGVTQYFVKVGYGRLRGVKRGPQGPIGKVLRRKMTVAQAERGKNDRHVGFARGHPPYYWPRLNALNFLDLTG